MHDHSWSYAPLAENFPPPADTNFGLWQGPAREDSSVGASAESLRDAAILPYKLSKGHCSSDMRHPNNPTISHLDNQQQQQQQQFMDYWSRQDDRILSPYVLGYHAQEPRPHSPPALSSGLASSQHEGNLIHIYTLCHVCSHF